MTAAQRTVFVNGKFAAQALTGVQRVASQWLLALDTLAPARRWVVLCPPGAHLPVYQHLESQHVGPAGLPLHLWEQLVLPWCARGGLLVNLAGSVPFFPRGQVCTLHDAAVFDHPQAYTPAFVRWYRLLFRRQARAAARLLTVSAFSQARLALHLGIGAARIQVVPNGGEHLNAVVPDESVLDRHGLRGRPFFLAVASANPTKNLARLVQAFARVDARLDTGLDTGLSTAQGTAQGISLVLVGGHNDKVFAGAGAGLAHAGIVRTGALTDAPLKALYQHALALVFPSVYEGFGIPPLEAMSCGCPVAAARAASIPAVCGDAAVYFDPLDTGAITQALQQMIDNAALRRRLVGAGHARVQHWRWRDGAAALQQAVQGVA